MCESNCEALEEAGPDSEQELRKEKKDIRIWSDWERNQGVQYSGAAWEDQLVWKCASAAVQLANSAASDHALQQSDWILLRA